MLSWKNGVSIIKNLKLIKQKRKYKRKNNISKPITNINAKAKCDLKKFTDYIFSDKYTWNGKRDLFEMLGFTVNDSQYLKEEYERQAVKHYCDSKYKLGILDTQGQRINIDINFVKNGRTKGRNYK